MLNNNRIVSVTATDLITLYGVALIGSGSKSLEKIDATDAGLFTVDTVTGAKVTLLSEPVKKANFTVESGTVFFVPAYDFEGFEVDGTAAEITGDIVADGVTLYKAVLATGAFTVTPVAG